jgi:hypothetical protein
MWQFDHFLRGSVRYGALIGSAVAVLLLAVAAGLVLRGNGTPGSEPQKPKEASVSAPGPGLAAAKPTEADRFAHPTAPIAPSFDVVKVGPTGTVVIAGRAEPGAKVIVRDGDKPIGEVTADRRGEWVLIPEQPTSPGDRLLSAEASSRGQTVRSDETVALSIGPSAPGDRPAGSALAVLLPPDGKGTARVLQRPDRVPPANPNALSMDTAQDDGQGWVVLSGHAAAGATVQIYLGNQPLATVTADTAGAWSATMPRGVTSGRLELRLDQLDSEGRVAQRIAFPAARMSPAEPAPGQSYVVQRGNNLWRIAQRAYGAGTRYVIIYSANPEQIRDPARIYPGQIFTLPKT